MEDGPGWWAARAAIDAGQARRDRSGTRSARPATALAARRGRARSWQRSTPRCWGATTSSGRLDERSVSVLRGLLSGRTQHELALAEGVSASAVSQRVRNDGLGIVLAVDEQLRGVR